MRKYIESLINKIINQDFCGVAAEMAFWFILGLFPFLLFLTSLFAWMGKKTLISPILNFITNIAPKDVSSLILDTLNEAMIFKQGTLIAVFGLVITIALAANAIAVIIKGLNRAYAIEETRSFIYTRILSVIMVFVNSLVLFLSVNLIVLGKVILDFMLEYTALSQLSIDIISIVRWPVTYLALSFSAIGNYYILPAIEGNDKIKFRSVLPGTFFFCFFWILGSWCFSLYLSNLNAYNKVYGAIGAVAILMVWMYYTSLIVLIGGEINARVYNKLITNKGKS
ncbi:MAG: YihY/virulence factor BrkB family protein [Candidatus Gastranaerophilales bacterium]|nr:YihY/virulence factor BrkB family protein [Candidatus Gastranaerophilales bacterium]